jgi:hypothetical protein
MWPVCPQPGLGCLRRTAAERQAAFRCSRQRLHRLEGLALVARRGQLCELFFGLHYLQERLQILQLVGRIRLRLHARACRLRGARSCPHACERICTQRISLRAVAARMCSTVAEPACPAASRSAAAASRASPTHRPAALARARALGSQCPRVRACSRAAPAMHIGELALQERR